MKTIDSTGYNYNEDGTCWLIQKVRYDDFGGIDPATASFGVIASFPTFARAREYFSSFCSGLQDDEGPCANQNFSASTFYRIVEVSEGSER